MGRPKKEAPAEEVLCAPQWMVTFSDCMNLLLTFFVLLVTFSSFGPEKEEEGIVNFGSAMRSAFGTPVDAGGRQDHSSMVENRRVVNTEQPESGSERPTGSQSPGTRNGSLNEDLQAADYRKHKVFLIPSRKVFLGRGKALSPDGRYFLAVMAAFLREVPGSIVISENGPDDDSDLGLSRALLVQQHLVSLESLGQERLSIAAESIAPPEETDGGTPIYHRQERMLEIVLLEGSVQQ